MYATNLNLVAQFRFLCFLILLLFLANLYPQRAQAAIMVEPRSDCPDNATADWLLNQKRGLLDSELTRNDLGSAEKLAEELLALLSASPEERLKRHPSYKVIKSRIIDGYCGYMKGGLYTNKAIEKQFTPSATTKVKSLTSIGDYHRFAEQYTDAEMHYRQAFDLATAEKMQTGLLFRPLQSLVTLNNRKNPYDEFLGKSCGPGDKQRGQIRALLIGVADYPNLPRKLKGTGNDVMLLKNALLALGGLEQNIVTLSGNGVTKIKALRAMHDLISQTRCGDFVMFHYSGMQLSQEIFFANKTGFKAPLGWASTIVFSDVKQRNLGSSLSGLIWGSELSEFVTAGRNRGASVFLVLDTGQAAGLGVQHFQTQVDKSVPWHVKANIPAGSLQESGDSLTNSTLLNNDAGDYVAFYATDVGAEAFEREFQDDEGKKETYGLFSYALGKVLQTKGSSSVRTLAENIAQTMSGFGFTAEETPAPVFEASNPNLIFLKTARALNDSALDVEILKPELARGFRPVLDSEFNFVGRINKPEQIAVLTVSNLRVYPDENGKFEANVKLTRGQNKVIIAAMDKTFGFRTKTITFQVQQDVEHFGSKGKRYALIIGNKDYKDDDIEDLVTPHADAKALANILKNKYSFLTEIQQPDGGMMSLLLLNATRTQVNKALNRLKNRLSVDDMLIVYYAGHGQVVNDFKGQIVDAYWIPVNGEDNDDTEWISSTRLTQTLRQIRARNILVIADSCYSGAMSRALPDNSAFENLPVNDERYRRLLMKQGAMQSRMLMSSGGTEPVLDEGCDGHSIFSCALLRALTKVEKTVFSASDLFKNHIEAAVGGTVRQVPQYKELRDSGHEGGDVIFFRDDT